MLSCVKERARGKLQYLARELCSMFCGDLEGWDGRCGGGDQKGEDICVHTADSCGCTAEIKTL